MFVLVIGIKFMCQFNKSSQIEPTKYNQHSNQDAEFSNIPKAPPITAETQKDNHYLTFDHVD